MDISLDRLTAELADFPEKGFDELGHRSVVLLPDNVADALFTELFPGGVFVFIDPIGYQCEHISRVEFNPLRGLEIALLQCTHREGRGAIPVTVT